jgi:hypothetical protein
MKSGFESAMNSRSPLLPIKAIRSMSVTLCRPCEAIHTMWLANEDLGKCAVSYISSHSSHTIDPTAMVVQHK